MESECLPQALALGVSYELFWSPGFCPRNVSAFVEAHKLKTKEQDELQYRMSCYINEAVFNATYNAIGLGFSSKKFKPVEYRKESYSSASEKRSKETGEIELTEEEIRERSVRIFELLELQAFNHRQAKKAKAKEAANES